MIRHVTHLYSEPESLRSELASENFTQLASNSLSQLVQIYCSETNQEHIQFLTSLIASRLPQAVIVGATTVGEITDGRLVTNHTVIGFTFFTTSNLHLVAISCEKGNERTIGAELGKTARLECPDMAGLLLLATTLSMDAAALLAGVQSTLESSPVFGGGAGDYAAMNQSWVFTDSVQLTCGAVAVAFCGEDLHIESQTYLGWRPLSRSMRVTKVDGLNVVQIDDQPAFEVYKRYLNIANDDQFYLNALEFPLLLERNNELLARVPVSTIENGSLQFIADIDEGEIVRLGYGDINLIIDDAKQIHQLTAEFAPQAVFLYTCGCRRFLMQESVDLETLPFQTLAPTFGFYTYGEFFGSSKLCLLNSTMVVVSLREGPKSETPDQPQSSSSASLTPTSLFNPSSEPPTASDPYANKHMRVVSRLLSFINAVTAELEASNREATKLSITDPLTQLVNRVRLEQVLNEWLNMARRYETPFSVILLDMDHFKSINDTFGHLVGDDVLVRIAQILTHNTRSVDTVGRWGGEEFLVIAPNTNLEEAKHLAEKLRHAIETTDIFIVGCQTASFGVATYTSSDDPHKLIARADAAMYAAKRGGRNRVEVR